MSYNVRGQRPRSRNTEYYVVSGSGFRTLIGVSAGVRGGFVFNTNDEKTNTLNKAIEFTKREINRNNGFISDSDGNKLFLDELLKFAENSQYFPPTSGGRDYFRDYLGYHFASFQATKMFDF